MQARLSLIEPDPDWIALLRDQIAAGRTITAVADEIGMKRPSLSMLLRGCYPARLDKVSRKWRATVVARYGAGIACPHLRIAIPDADCRAHASAPMSTSDPERLRQWAACRACALNPLASVRKQEP